MIHLSMEERIQKLEDIEKIRNLMGTYCHSVDARDKETFLTIWDKEANYEVALGVSTGINEISNMFDTIVNDADQHHHQNTNIVINVDGISATAISDVFFYRLDTKGESFLLSGKYEDEFNKSSGRWLFSRRKYTNLVKNSPRF